MTAPDARQPVQLGRLEYQDCREAARALVDWLIGQDLNAMEAGIVAGEAAAHLAVDRTMRGTQADLEQALQMFAKGVRATAYAMRAARLRDELRSKASDHEP